MKPPRSATTTKRLGELTSVGIMPSDAGSGARLPIAAPVGPGLGPPGLSPLLRRTIDARTMHWLVSLRSARTLPTGMDPGQIRHDLAPVLTRVNALLAPADDAAIIQALTSLATLFQVSIPEGDGLALYVAALAGTPAPALQEACVSLAREHRYPRLPFPAEILEAARHCTAELRYWHDLAVRALSLTN